MWAWKLYYKKTDDTSLVTGLTLKVKANEATPAEARRSSELWPRADAVMVGKVVCRT